MPPLPALSLLVLRAHDVDALAAFYARLGLAFAPERHGQGPAHMACLLDGWVLEIYPRARGMPGTDGLRWGLAVPCVETALAALGDAPVLMPPRATRHGRRAAVKDPEGHVLELVELAP